MKPDELQQLLGGYATGSLTPEEQKLLFEAALRDQELFDALVREQGLKEAFDEPAVRHELIAELEQVSPPWRERLAAWLRPRYPIGAAALAVSAAVVMIVALVRTGDRSAEVKPIEVAEVRQPAPPAITTDSQPASGPTTPGLRRAKAPVSNQAPAPAEKPAALLDQAAPKEEPARAPSGVVGGVIGGIVSGPATAAAPPPPPPPPPAAAAESQVVEDRAFKAAATSSFRDEGTGLQARELFYRSDFPPPAAFGVIGGAPGASMRQNERRSATPARAVQPLGLRYAVTRKETSAQITVEANSDSVLYVFRQSTSGEWAAVTPGGLSLKARASATVPDVAAPAPVLMLLSRRPLPELAQTGSALSGTLEKLQAGGNAERQVTQQVDQSTYVVAPLPRPTEVLVVKTEVKP